MLALPESGVSRSIKNHNSNMENVCDWIEASAILLDGPVSKSDVVDILIENEIYKKQDFAEEFVSLAWGVLKRRFSRVGAPLGVEVSATRISKSGSWSEFPAYAFCLYLSCVAYLYPKAMEKVANSIKQGALFERLSEEALKEMFPRWKIWPLGWTPDNPVKLTELVEEITGRLCEVSGAEIALHVTAKSKELGLDLLLYRDFSDESASFPVMMIQCASGKNWIKKRNTPDLAIWQKVVSFNARPMRGMTIPYAFVDSDAFRRGATSVDGVFFDRCRLLAPSENNGNWVSEKLDSDLRKFLKSRIVKVPDSAFAG